jgi:hypothetical protein
MPALTPRRDRDARQETWLIHYSDVRVGTIAERVGNAGDAVRIAGVALGT